MWWIIAIVVTLILLFYALWGRAWLKTKPWAQGFFAAIEPIEIVLFKKSETILVARLKMAVGVTLTILTYLGTINLAPIMPFVPGQYTSLVQNLFNLLPMLITLVGMADEKLRNTTTKPLELVAVPDKAVETDPRIAEAVAMADATKSEAVAVVTEAKAV
jgi:hypothetical protein